MVWWISFFTHNLVNVWFGGYPVGSMSAVVNVLFHTQCVGCPILHTVRCCVCPMCSMSGVVNFIFYTQCGGCLCVDVLQCEQGNSRSRTRSWVERVETKKTFFFFSGTKRWFLILWLIYGESSLRKCDLENHGFADKTIPIFSSFKFIFFSWGSNSHSLTKEFIFVWRKIIFVYCIFQELASCFRLDGIA